MLGRPDRSEAAPFYFTYIDRITSDDPVAVMRAQLDDTLAWAGPIAEQRSLHRYAPDKWSLRQLLNHVNDSERVFAFRALWVARGYTGPLPGFDQTVAAAAARADDTPWAQHVEDFRRVRLASLSLFQNLSADAWRRGGVASDHQVTVRALAYIIAGHLAHHRAIAAERYA